jgi:ribulose-5-phosphate 4-epimerase/fuculose-1-phosphate aldolase
LIANHGLIVGEKNLESAIKLTEEVENLSKQYLQILKSGKKPVLLSKNEMKKNIKKIKDYNYGTI